MVKNPPAKLETQVQTLCREDSLEKEMANWPSILVWEIPWRATVHDVWVEHDLGTKQ